MKTSFCLTSLCLLSFVPRLCTATDVLVPLMRISSGSAEDYVDTNGNVWSADKYFDSGGVRTGSRRIAGTDDDELYYTFRTRGRGFTYEIPASDLGLTGAEGEAAFQVKLLFCDVKHQEVGARVMDVIAQDQLVLDDLDVFAAAGGRRRPHTEAFNVTVVAGSLLKLEFQPVVHKPILSALQISKFGTAGPPEEPAGLPTSAPDDGKQFEFPSTGPHQPFVQIVEYPARRSEGSVSLPQGSPWCPDNGPAFWWIGHDNTPERPVCQALDGSWSKETALVALDTNDPLNDIDGPGNIDRHDCAINDNNADGVPDLICVVGANSGNGVGYNEVYITQEDGSVKKILDGHGLQKYPTMRTRKIEPLLSARGEPMVMITTTGGQREGPNHHRMFKQVSFGPELKDIFFEEVDGPFIKENGSGCLVPADLNNDGIDDFASCVGYAPADLYVQHTDNTWSQVDLSSVPNNEYVESWADVRVVDVNKDGLNDIVVVGPVKAFKEDDLIPYVRIFLGDASLQDSTIFDFTKPYWEQELPYDVFSVEVLDTNDDGALDIYVTQVNMYVRGTYCRDYKNPEEWRENGWNFKNPNPGWSPPLDEAADYLFLGVPEPTDELFTSVTMDHALPGCGFKTRLWNEKSIQLGNGDLGVPGEHAILQW